MKYKQISYMVSFAEAGGSNNILTAKSRFKMYLHSQLPIKDWLIEPYAYKIDMEYQNYHFLWANKREAMLKKQKYINSLKKNGYIIL